MLCRQSSKGTRLTIGQSEFKDYSDAMMDRCDLDKDKFPKVKEKSKFLSVSLNLSVLSCVSSLIGHLKAGHLVFLSPVSRCVPPPLCWDLFDAAALVKAPHLIVCCWSFAVIDLGCVH